MKKNLKFIERLTQELDLLEKLIDTEQLEDYGRIGAEQEFCVLDNNFRANPINRKILKEIQNEGFVTEIAKFNMELNVEPLDINKSWAVYKKLNLKKMKLESKFFLGKHNLEAFRSIDCQASSPIKTINDIKINQKGNNITITVLAKSFLHSQVRIMVGTLVDIGLNKIEKSISEIIQSKKREFAGVTAPPQGLYLLKIDY